MKKHFFLFIFLFVCAIGYNQDCCDNDTKLVICYTPADEYCPVFNCPYNFDKSQMEGIRNKLANAANFGPNGISTCDVETIPLVNISNVTDINNLNCDIIFIGAFYTDANNILNSTLDVAFTDIIKEWSVECPENLTILFQGESERWGYEIEDDNVNPNTPGGIATPNIFDGPFGSLNEFSQGGSFQANFRTIPSTGATILAVDALDRPTIVLDIATNDILMADVGIVCNQAGDVTISDQVINSNDILACNIFALGCEIAGENTFTEESVSICLNSSYTLPDGMVVNQEGEYTSNLIGSGNCDSIIVTTVAFSIPEDSLYTYMGCEDDPFEIEIGGTIYNEMNPTGSETIQTVLGCDSLVNIQLSFYPDTETTLDVLICEDETFDYLGVTFTDVSDTILVIPNANNCDSLINVIVDVFRFDNVEVTTTEFEILNNDVFTFDNIIPSSYAIFWEPTSGLSCVDCPNPTLNNEENIEAYTMTITSEEGCEKEFNYIASYICTPYIPNVFNPQSNVGNDKYGPLTSCNMTDYSFTIYDRWGSIVFETDDQQALWDGRLKSKDVQPGIYVYQCAFSNKGVIEERYGHLTLVR